MLTAGVLSYPHQRHIVAGRFARDLNSPAYFHRRVYGLCWTALYYFKPVYFLCLSILQLKFLTFRIFGYRGCVDFTIYPDTWVRDLPLLDFGPGAYVSNRATIGTNIVMLDGSILVDGISVGRGSCIGHLLMLGPGVTVGTNVDVGVGAAIGLQTNLMDGAKIGPALAIEHGVEVNVEAVIGSVSYLGSCSRIGREVTVPPGSLIPRRARVKTSEEALAYVSSATRTDRSGTTEQRRVNEFPRRRASHTET
jgi:carbonic anhydrase/acetyltransferase-like protein (isoleucine patch superfamily)